MRILLSRQFLTLAYSLALGAFFALSWDTVRISRVFMGVRYGKNAENLFSRPLPLLPPSRPRRAMKARLLPWIIGIQDFCTLAQWGAMTAVFFYYTQDGQWRFFSLCGIAIGFAIYYNTIGRMVIGLSQWIAFLLWALTRYVVFFLVFPFQWLWKKTAPRLVLLGKRLRSSLLSLWRAFWLRRWRRRQKKALSLWLTSCLECKKE